MKLGTLQIGVRLLKKIFLKRHFQRILVIEPFRWITPRHRTASRLSPRETHPPERLFFYPAFKDTLHIKNAKPP